MVQRFPDPADSRPPESFPASAAERLDALLEAQRRERLRTEARAGFRAGAVASAARFVFGALETTLVAGARSLHTRSHRLVPPPLHHPLRLLLRPLTGRIDGSPESPPPAEARDGSPELIVLGVIAWSYRYQRPQHLASRFAGAGWRVLHVSPRLVPGPSAGSTPVADGVSELLLAPARKLSPVADRLEEPEIAELVRQIRSFLRGPVAPAVLVQFPFWSDVARRLAAETGGRLIYDLIDDHAGFPSVAPEVIAPEADLIREADAVTVTSERLEARVRELGRRPIRIPNGAELDRFSSLPPALRAFSRRRPVVGYIGAVSRWLDVPLLGELARRRPEWTFVLIGNTYGADLAPLMFRGNVRLVGEVPYEELPPIVHDFDVALVPFVRNPLTEATDPIKLYEYLAAGVPVVATRLPETSRHAPFVETAEGADEYESAIVRLLATDSPGLRLRRRRSVAGDDWDARFEAMRRAIAG